MGNKVYLDDVLLDAKSRRSLNIGRRAVVHKLRQAGFIISVKNEARSTERIGFVGKRFDTLRKYIQNQPAVLAGAFRMWIRAVGTGRITASDLMRLLGRWKWLIHPASLSCFLATAFRATYSGEDRFTGGLIRSTATALVFSLLPQSYKSRPAQDGRVCFADAAPPSASLFADPDGTLLGLTLQFPNKPRLWILNYYGLQTAATKKRQDAFVETHQWDVLMGDFNDSIWSNTPSRFWHDDLLNRRPYDLLHKLYPDGSVQAGHTRVCHRRHAILVSSRCWGNVSPMTCHTVAMPTSNHRLVLMTTGLTSTE